MEIDEPSSSGFQSLDEIDSDSAGPFGSVTKFGFPTGSQGLWSSSGSTTPEDQTSQALTHLQVRAFNGFFVTFTRRSILFTLTFAFLDIL